jgi:putative transposase
MFRASSPERRGRAVHPIKWRSKYGGMEVSDAKKLKALEAENARLKKLLAEQMMDVSTLKEMLGKNF